MNITAARSHHSAVLARRTQLVAVAASATPGPAARRAWKAVEQADRDLTFAQMQVEQATRAAMVGATERDIMTAAVR